MFRYLAGGTGQKRKLEQKRGIKDCLATIGDPNAKTMTLHVLRRQNSSVPAKKMLFRTLLLVFGVSILCFVALVLLAENHLRGLVRSL